MSEHYDIHISCHGSHVDLTLNGVYRGRGNTPSELFGQAMYELEAGDYVPAWDSRTCPDAGCVTTRKHRGKLFDRTDAVEAEAADSWEDLVRRGPME